MSSQAEHPGGGTWMPGDMGFLAAGRKYFVEPVARVEKDELVMAVP